jgi:muramoyltetrapeptide carboxypeptidase
MSDITALHIAIQQKTGFVTFLAPILNFFDQTHKDFDDEYAWVSLEKLLEDPTHQEVILPEEFKQEMLNPNKVQGKLVGGNLSLISAMCGTEWQLNTDGKILILEDVGEQIQWIDRKLWQLKNAGLLQKPAAVILANWKDCKPGFKHSLELQEVLNHYFQDAPYPVIIGYPTGHDKYQAALPLNAPFSINPININ